MNIMFAQALSQLRREKGISQRQAARDLGVSQALLSHYENGIREPGLAFVAKVCDYYQVSADYLLGRAAYVSPVPGAPLSARRDTGAMLHTADALSEACADLCQRDPELCLLFRRLAGQLNKRLGKEGEAPLAKPDEPALPKAGEG
jgi:transcriptional regulator with XRE-family HTH domain